METWADRICALETMGWSLTDIAREIGLSAQAVSDLKQGRSSAPRGMAAVKLHQLAQSPPNPPSQRDSARGG